MTATPANAPPPGQARFLRLAHGHLLAAVAVFVCAEVALFRGGIAEPMARAMYRVPWPFILGAYIVVGYLASRAAHRLRRVG